MIKCLSESLYAYETADSPDFIGDHYAVNMHVVMAIVTEIRYQFITK